MVFWGFEGQWKVITTIVSRHIYRNLVILKIYSLFLIKEKCLYIDANCHCATRIDKNSPMIVLIIILDCDEKNVIYFHWPIILS